ncbi:MAG: YggT family protein [Actinomycetota bacterium]
MAIICYALTAYTIILLIRIVLSWTSMFWSPPSGLTPAIRIVYDLTEPVMGMFRRVIPPIGGLDLSPILIFIIINLIQGQICY